MIWILQQVDGNIIAPKIIGSSVGLSSFWVLFAILLFGGLYGFFGMIIGSPIFAVIYHIIGKIIRKYARIRGEEEFVSLYEEEFNDTKPRPTVRSLFKWKTKENKMADVSAAESEPVTEVADGNENAGLTAPVSAETENGAS